MESEIEKLFYGKLGNFEFIDRSEEEKREMDEVIANDKKLTELLKNNQDAKEIFMRFKDAMDECNNSEILRFYKEGFRNGFLLALDILDE